MRKKIFDGAVLFLALTACIIALYSKSEPDRIAYIRSSDLIQQYAGMKEAQSEYLELERSLKVQMAEMETALKKQFDVLQQSRGEGNEDEIRLAEQKFAGMQRQYEQVRQNIEAELDKRDEELTQGVLNQINAYVDAYGESNEYRVILGTTSSGNLLYGEDAIDITDDVLLALNKEYEGL